MPPDPEIVDSIVDRVRLVTTPRTRLRRLNNSSFHARPPIASPVPSHRFCHASQTPRLPLPLRAANAERSHVLTASGRRRHEARFAKQALEKEPALAKADLKEDKFSCRPHGADCWWDSQCCEDMECLGIINWACGHSPGRVGEFCNSYYHCAEELACHEDVCTDYRDLIDWGSDEGKCATGSDWGGVELTVMTFNTFLFARYLEGSLVSGQNEQDREARVDRIVAWAKTRPEDVIAVQGVYSFKEDVVAGMVAAGFCHYAVTPFGAGGAGLAIFSKYRIKDVNFWDFYDVTGPNGVSIDHPWLMDLNDRGVMLATVAKDEKTYNILNTHTMADLKGDQHLIRMGEYLFLREVANKLPANEAVFFVGGMNEDKFRYAFGKKLGDHYYREMLDELRAAEPWLGGDNLFSYNTMTNPLARLVQDGEFSQRLDYVLYSLEHAPPSGSMCEILHPLWPAGCADSPHKLECHLSDHYPVTCRFSFVDKGTPGGDGKGDPAVSLRVNAPAAIVATRPGIANTTALRG